MDRVKPVEVLFARQPILDRQRNLYGYELLFRSDPTSNAFDGTEAAEATMQVLSSALMSIGTENLLLNNQRAFVNFDLALLQSGIYLSLPSESIVIEILETVEPSDELDRLCQRVKQQGYCLALDDYADGPRFEPLTQVAGIIKVDVRATSQQEQVCIPRPMVDLNFANKVAWAILPREIPQGE